MKKKANSPTPKTRQKSASDELVDASGLVKAIMWTQRFIAIAEELRDNGLPYTDIQWVSTIANYAYPESDSQTHAIGFCGNRGQTIASEEDTESEIYDTCADLPNH